MNINKKQKRIWIIILLYLIIFTIIGVNSKMNKKFVIREKTLKFNNLSKSFNNYKILQFFDLHSKEFRKNDNNLINPIIKKTFNPPEINVLLLKNE